MASTTGGEENHRLTWAPWPAVDGMEALHSARDRHALPPRTLPWRDDLGAIPWSRGMRLTRACHTVDIVLPTADRAALLTMRFRSLQGATDVRAQ